MGPLRESGAMLDLSVEAICFGLFYPLQVAATGNDYFVGFLKVWDCCCNLIMNYVILVNSMLKKYNFNLKFLILKCVKKLKLE